MTTSISQLWVVIPFTHHSHLVTTQLVKLVNWLNERVLEENSKAATKKSPRTQKTPIDSQDVFRSPPQPHPAATKPAAYPTLLRSWKTDALSWQPRLHFVWNCRCPCPPHVDPLKTPIHSHTPAFSFVLLAWTVASSIMLLSSHSLMAVFFG